jgi:hypothetical protein
MRKNAISTADGLAILRFYLIYFHGTLPLLGQKQMKQRTVFREFSISGISLRFGQRAAVAEKPIPPNTGAVFRRTDMPGKPEIVPRVESVGELVEAMPLISVQRQCRQFRKCHCP